MIDIRTVGAVVVAGALALLPASSANAQASYPAQNITIIVAFPPGGGVDLSSRTVAAKLTEALGKTVIVENRPGASGQIAVQAVLRSAPDGYTFLTTSNSPIVIGPHLSALAYDPTKELTPVSIMAWGMLGIAVGPNSPYGSMAELITAAKQSTAGLSYSTPGLGTQMHLAGELLKSITGANLVVVGYRGTGPAAAAVMSGEVPVAISDLTSLLSQAEAGRVKLLAIANSRRSVAAPQIPTVAEAGVPGYGADAWTGMFAPARTPPDIIRRVNAEVSKALAMEDVKAAFLKGGLEPVILTAEESRTVVTNDSNKWGGVIKTANIKVDN